MNEKTFFTWRLFNNRLEDYPLSIEQMEQSVDRIIAGDEQEQLWALEYLPLYTAGTSAKPEDLLEKNLLPVFQVGRGGQYTYHGPGMRIYYALFDLKKRYAPHAPDLRQYVHDLEEVVIRCLARLGVTAMRREGRVGIWVHCDTPKEAKIAAIGIRVRKWVSYHGVALNINPDLSHYSGIIPCGIHRYGVTSLAELGIHTEPETIDSLFREEINRLFGTG